MTKNILALIGALAIVVLIGGAAYKTFGPAPALPVPTSAAPFQQATPRAIFQIPITQHFCQRISVGPLGQGAISITMPSGAGLALKSFIPTGPSAGWDEVEVRVDGLTIFRSLIRHNADTGYGSGQVTVDPPIIVRPGSTMTLLGNTAFSFNLAGYQLTASDFGL